MVKWNAINKNQLNTKVQEALEENINFKKSSVFGLPATFLDEVEFYDDAPFLHDAPFLRTLIANPNHIGCHTLGDSESYFEGTQKLEKELIAFLAENIFKAEPGSYDGYVSAGGTEANIQGMWVYRNFFKNEHAIDYNEMAVLTSVDSHYSVDKAANLLGVDIEKLDVEDKTRQIDLTDLKEKLASLQRQRKKALIIQLNMGTTMFGSVDNIDKVVDQLKASEMKYRIHIDAAFGGFIYPFSQQTQNINFQHPEVSSISMDAHKMLQAPYGTGIFMVRKGMIQHTLTSSAKYVQGLDYTLSGSRSGANAIAVWMILNRYGRSGWTEKIQNLLGMTDHLSETLDQMQIEYFREPGMNIVAFDKRVIDDQLRKQYNIVTDGEHAKIVVMPHVTREKMNEFIKELKNGIITRTVQ